MNERVRPGRQLVVGEDHRAISMAIRPGVAGMLEIPATRLASSSFRLCLDPSAPMNVLHDGTHLEAALITFISALDGAGLWMGFNGFGVIARPEL